MLILVIYDISDNIQRNHLIKMLQHHGLHRIQKSAFLGNLNSQRRDELEESVEEYISGPKDSIYLIPICEKCQNRTTIFSVDERFLEDVKHYRIV